MRVLKSKQVKKYVEAQDKSTRERLNAALNNLPNGDVIPIAGLPNTFRLRIGKFRAIFIKEYDIIKVTVLDSRGQIYKKGE